MSTLRTLGGLMRSPVLPVTTWPNRPAANGFPAGTVLPIEWPDGVPRQFVADPTNNRWRPKNGVVELYRGVGSAVATPIATITGDGTIKLWALPVDCLIPGGMLYPGSILTVGVVARKFGTHTGVVESALGTSAAGASANLIGALTSNAAAQTWIRGSSDALVRSGGFYTAYTLSIDSTMTTNATTGQFINATDANIATEDRWVVFRILSSYTDSSAELHAYTVRFRG